MEREYYLNLDYLSYVDQFAVIFVRRKLKICSTFEKIGVEYKIYIYVHDSLFVKWALRTHFHESCYITVSSPDRYLQKAANRYLMESHLTFIKR